MLTMLEEKDETSVSTPCLFFLVLLFLDFIPASVAFFELKTFDAAKQPIVSIRFRFGYYGN